MTTLEDVVRADYERMRSEIAALDARLAIAVHYMSTHKSIHWTPTRQDIAEQSRQDFSRRKNLITCRDFYLSRYPFLNSKEENNGKHP